MSVDVEEALNAILKANGAVVAIAGTRVFPNRLPARESMPAVITRRLSGSAVKTLRSVSSTRRAVFQVESWSAVSQEEARELDRAVQTVAASTGQESVDWWVQCIRVNDDTDQDNPQIPIHADDVGLFCSFCEIMLVYEPAS